MATTQWKPWYQVVGSVPRASGCSLKGQGTTCTTVSPLERASSMGRVTDSSRSSGALPGAWAITLHHGHVEAREQADAHVAGPWSPSAAIASTPSLTSRGRSIRCAITRFILPAAYSGSR